LNINNSYLKNIVTNKNNPFCYNEVLEKYDHPNISSNNTNLESNYSINNTLTTKLSSSENNSSTSTSNTSTSSISLPSFQNNNYKNHNKNVDAFMKPIATIDNKQTYV
jgi:hypothetical protein